MKLPAQVAVYWEPFKEVWVALVHGPYMENGTLVMDHKHYPYETKEEADDAAREFADSLVKAGHPKVVIFEQGEDGNAKIVWSSS
jgi:hypothetical protein